MRVWNYWDCSSRHSLSTHTHTGAHTGAHARTHARAHIHPPTRTPHDTTRHDRYESRPDRLLLVGLQGTGSPCRALWSSVKCEILQELEGGHTTTTATTTATTTTTVCACVRSRAHVYVCAFVRVCPNVFHTHKTPAQPLPQSPPPCLSSHRRIANFLKPKP